MKNLGSEYLSGFEWRYTGEEEEGGFSSHCLELGVSSCGDTWEEALANVREAVQLHLETLAEVGELNRYLVERGVIPAPVIELRLSVDGAMVGNNVPWIAGPGTAPGQAEASERTAQHSRVQ